MQLSDRELAAIRALDGDLPIAPRPFGLAGEAVGLTEEQLVAVARGLVETGVIRRFSIVPRHVAVGARANAMVVWRVPKERWDEVGEQMAQFTEVSHCYRRAALPDLEYTHYTMVHGPTREACTEAVARIAAATGLDDYVMLFTRRELKRSSPRYLGTPNEDSDQVAPR